MLCLTTLSIFHISVFKLTLSTIFQFVLRGLGNIVERVRVNITLTLSILKYC